MTARTAIVLSVCLLALGSPRALVLSEASAASNPAVWKVKTPTASVVLFGSIHYGTPEMYPLSGVVEKEFREAETLVTEIDWAPVNREQARRLLASYGNYPPGESLSKHLEAELVDKIVSVLEPFGFARDEVERMRPWYIAMLVSSLGVSVQGYSSEWGIEEHFYRRSLRKRRHALETIGEQAEVFRGLDDRGQLEFLQQTFEDAEPTAATKLSDIIAAWSEGNVEELDRIISGTLRARDPELYERLFTARNRRMAERIEGYLQSDGDYFVIVGSGHLVGPDSVLRFLEEKGFAPKRL